MRITILVDCYYPKISAGAKLIHDLAIEFLRREHTVTIITPTETITQKYEVEHVPSGADKTLRVVRVRTGKIKGAQRALRALQEFRLSSNIWNNTGDFLRDNPADLLIFYSPSIFWAPLVRRLKALWDCPSYLILRDIFPQWAVDAGILRKGLAWYFLCRKERQQYLNADVIGVQSPSNLHYFDDKFPSLKARKEVLYNWSPRNEPDIPCTSFRKLWGLENKVVFIYGGNIGVAQDMDNLLRLATNVAANKDICFVFVGSGSEVDRLSRQIELNGLQNVRIFPALEPMQYQGMVSEFDVGLLSLDRRLTTHNVPGKLLGYLYNGLPVLASLNPGNDLFALLEENGAGICILNGDDERLRAGALRLAADKEMRKEMGRGARVLLETTFSVESAAQQILSSVVPRSIQENGAAKITSTQLDKEEAVLG
jgi:O26-antigen biosynthesis N-acetyl-L-fucosamine transferase